jgi:hypothetical protein
VRRLLLVLATFGLAGAFVGGAYASTGTPGQGHFEYSDNWQGITFVTGLDSCPIFGGNPVPFYAFQSVDLTDHIDSTWTPIDGGPLYTIKSVGSAHGVIDASDGTYHVAGGGFKENRTGTFPLFFSGTGHATITGPGGTVTGTATFQDLLDFPPPEFDLFFTGINSCHLN